MLKDQKFNEIPIQFEITKQIDDRFTNVKIYLMHLGLNLNGSVFKKDVVERCWNTLALTPILGFIQMDENSNIDFDGHKNILVIKNGEYEIKYIGQAYGCIGENCNPRWELKTDQYGVQREYLVCDGVLWSGKYSDVKEIMDRDITKKESMELDKNYSGHFDDNGNFVFSDFKFYGACMLADKKTEAMTGACVTKEFSFEELKEEIQKNMELLKFTLTKQDSSPIDNDLTDAIGKDEKNDNFTNEGGLIELEKKLELLKKFTNLTEEDLNSIVDLEKYSLEDLEKELTFMSYKKESQIKYDTLVQENEDLKTQNREFTTQIEELKTEKVELQTKFDELQSNFTTLETDKTEIETKFTTLETEVEALRTFKDNTLTKQRKDAEETLYEMFSQKLNQDEIQSIKDVAMNFSIEDLEEKLYALVARKEVKFEKVAKKIDVTFEKEEHKEINKNGKPYDDILEQYIK